eukprot:g23657.t1
MGEDDSPQPSMHSMEVTFSLLSGQSLKLTLSRRDATVKAARQQIARLCCMPEQAVHLLNEGHVLEDELHLLGLESIQLIFDASCLRKSYLPGISSLGLWHGVQARFRLLNPVPLGTWATATFREACQINSSTSQRSSSSIFRYSANLDNGAFHCMNAIKKSGSVGRHFAISIEGLDQYRARIFRPFLALEEYILYDPASHTGAPGEAREMGCLRLRSKRRVGPSDLDFVMPKVREDGTAAQFRPLALKESISQIYERGSLEHLQILRGTSDVSIELRLHGEAIFEAHPMDKTWAGLVTGSALRSYVQTELGPCKTELRNFLSEAFEGIFPGIRVGRDLLSEEAISGFEKVLLTAIEENDFRAETALEEAIRLVPSQFNSDARVLVLLAELEDAVCTSSVMGELESPDDAEEPVQFSTVVSFEAERHDVDPEDVFSDRLEPLVLYQSQVMEVQECWKRFLSNYERPEEAGEAIFASIVDSAPSLQSLFKGQKFIAGKFINRFHEMVMNLQSPTALISLVEQTGFQHLLIDISVPRIAVFRPLELGSHRFTALIAGKGEALIEAISNETPDVTPLATSGLQRLMSYAGGSFIYIRENFAKRLGLISDSWKKVALKQEEPEEQEQEHDAENAPEDDEDDWEEEDKLAKGASFWEEQGYEGYQAIPRNFESMFRFNAAVMGISGQEWMYEVLDSFDTMVRCISQSVRLQVECDVVSLRIAIVGGEVKFSNFKACSAVDAQV